jgi:hypothetical protein
MSFMESPSRSGRRLAAFSFLLGMGGCAGASHKAGAGERETSYRVKAAGWIGKTEKELVRGLGEPNSSITVPSGETFDEYRDSGCAITFRIDPSGVIADVLWKGDCASPELPPSR